MPISQDEKQHIERLTPIVRREFKDLMQIIVPSATHTGGLWKATYGYESEDNATIEYDLQQDEWEIMGRVPPEVHKSGKGWYRFLNRVLALKTTETCRAVERAHEQIASDDDAGSEDDEESESSKSSSVNEDAGDEAEDEDAIGWPPHAYVMAPATWFAAVLHHGSVATRFATCLLYRAAVTRQLRKPYDEDRQIVASANVNDFTQWGLVEASARYIALKKLSSAKASGWGAMVKRLKGKDKNGRTRYELCLGDTWKPRSAAEYKTKGTK